MTVERAISLAAKLNKTGAWRENWFYYPCYNEISEDWFVMRSLKMAHVIVAVFSNGKLSFGESL